MTTETTTLLSLPPDLQQEILCRTPAEVLIRSKQMCKKFNALIKTLFTTEEFVYKHFDQSPERFIRTVDTVTVVVDPVTKTRSRSSPVPEEFQDRNFTNTLLHCDGLLLCKLRDSHVKRFDSSDDDPRRPQIALWNPFLRKVKWLPSSGVSGYYDNYGFGYKDRGDYMILRFPQIKFKFVDGETPVEIYELKKDSWRTLENVKVDWVVDSSCQGVSVLGKMYWLAEKKHKSYILAFDFTAESFKDLCLCPPTLDDDRYLSCYSNNRLSLLQQDRESKKMEVWVSDNLADESVSFTKHFCVTTPGIPALKPRGYMSSPAYCFLKTTTIAALCEGEGDDGQVDAYCTLYKIDEHGLIDTTEIERISEEQGQPICCGHLYVPCLVRLP